MSERVATNQQVDNVTTDFSVFQQRGGHRVEALALRTSDSQRRLKTGSLGLNGFFVEGNKYPDNRQILDGSTIVTSDANGIENINDSTMAGFLGQECRYIGGLYHANNKRTNSSNN